MTIHGQGDFRYRWIPDWAEIPEEIAVGDAAGIACDASDNVYVFARSEPPVLVFDRTGRLQRTWGQGMFTRPHAVSVGPDGTIWLTDDGDHSVRQFTPEGRLLLTIGTPGRPAPFTSGLPFCRCTHTAHSPEGDIYVTDGYGNARVHKYDPAGRPILSWGQFGSMPGEFNIPHNVVCDADGWVYVADRENHRVQVFDGHGRFETQWNNLHRPNGLCLHPHGACPFCVIGEGGPDKEIQKGFPNLGPRVSIVDMQGRLLSRFGELGPGEGDGTFLSPHGIAVDSRGDIYVGEVARHSWVTKYYKHLPPPAQLRVIHKFERLG